MVRIKILSLEGESLKQINYHLSITRCIQIVKTILIYEKCKLISI